MAEARRICRGAHGGRCLAPREVHIGHLPRWVAGSSRGDFQCGMLWQAEKQSGMHLPSEIETAKEVFLRNTYWSGTYANAPSGAKRQLEKLPFLICNQFAHSQSRLQRHYFECPALIVKILVNTCHHAPPPTCLNTSQ